MIKLRKKKGERRKGENEYLLASSLALAVEVTPSHPSMSLLNNWISVLLTLSSIPANYYNND